PVHERDVGVAGRRLDVGAADVPRRLDPAVGRGHSGAVQQRPDGMAGGQAGGEDDGAVEAGQAHPDPEPPPAPAGGSHLSHRTTNRLATTWVAAGTAQEPLAWR